MARQFTCIDDALAGFIQAQAMFFVATAPSGTGGHINLSPKGLDTFRVIDANTVAYLDLTGSGVETIAHLRQNGRIVILFCSFTGAPRIVRLHGHGTAVTLDHPDFNSLFERFPQFDAPRAVIRVALERISDSCGYGVPLYRYEGERSQLQEWARRKGPDGLVRYRAENNRQSIDGLPGLPVSGGSDSERLR